MGVSLHAQESPVRLTYTVQFGLLLTVILSDMCLYDPFNQLTQSLHACIVVHLVCHCPSGINRLITACQLSQASTVVTVAMLCPN